MLLDSFFASEVGLVLASPYFCLSSGVVLVVPLGDFVSPTVFPDRWHFASFPGHHPLRTVDCSNNPNYAFALWDGFFMDF